MTPFMKALQRMHKDHITAVLGESTGKLVKESTAFNCAHLFEK